MRLCCFSFVTDFNGASLKFAAHFFASASLNNQETLSMGDEIDS
jgi:hypothetical protein